MATYLPISSPFIRFAGRYVDEAFGVAAGWNFFVFEAALVPFEVTACNVIVGRSFLVFCSRLFFPKHCMVYVSATAPNYF